MFGIELETAALLPALLVALSAGILSFLSPCVLPIVPPYLAYMGGISLGEETHKNKVILPALFFVMGLSTVFLLLGFAASYLGSVLLQYQSLMAKISGAVVIVFALHFLGVFRIKMLESDMRVDAKTEGGSALGAYVLGLAFAFGWSPCLGPQLGTILLMAANEGSVQTGAILLATYAIGLGLPFILTAVFFTRAMGLMSRIKRHMGTIEKVMGVLLLCVGIALMTGAFSAFSFWLLEVFPSLAALG
ncbi:MAG: cytochrome c biogenesis CcdA family protein [Halocynthiibacter sp.]